MFCSEVLDFVFFVLCLNLGVLGGSIGYAFAYSAAYSRLPTATAQQLQRGEHTGESRCTQRHQPSLLPTFYVESAASPVLPACHFGGNIAQIAINAIS